MPRRYSLSLTTLRLSTCFSSSIELKNATSSLLRLVLDLSFIEAQRVKVQQILEGKPDVVTIAINPGKPGDNSDLLMREAAAQMAVAGVTLDQFDPWGATNPFRKKSQVKKKRKTGLLWGSASCRAERPSHKLFIGSDSAS